MLKFVYSVEILSEMIQFQRDDVFYWFQELGNVLRLSLGWLKWMLVIDHVVVYIRHSNHIQWERFQNECKSIKLVNIEITWDQSF